MSWIGFHSYKLIWWNDSFKQSFIKKFKSTYASPTSSSDKTILKYEPPIYSPLSTQKSFNFGNCRNQILTLWYALQKFSGHRLTQRQQNGQKIHKPLHDQQHLLFAIELNRLVKKSSSGVQFMSFSTSSTDVGTTATTVESKGKSRTIILNSLFVIVGLMYMEFCVFKEDLAKIVPDNAPYIELLRPSAYVQLDDPMTFPVPDDWQSLLPWITKCASLDHALSWRLAQETKSPDPEIRSAAIRKLASLKNLTEAECRSIAFLVDFRTAVELAHSDADPRMMAVSKCRFPRRDKIFYPTKFREIIGALPRDAIHPELHALAQEALKSYDPTEKDSDDINWETATGFESEPIIAKAKRQFSELQLLKHCLMTLLSHSRNRDQIPTMLNYGVLDLLSDIALQYEDNTNIMGIVAKLFSNLSWHTDFYYELKKSGLLRLITQLSQSCEFQVNLPTRKALHNLDRSENTPMIPPGIYQLYPDFKSDETLLAADVIFIHGIKGSTFRTWRAHDALSYWQLGEKRIDEPLRSRMPTPNSLQKHVSATLETPTPFSTFVSPGSTKEQIEGKFRERLTALKNGLYMPEHPIIGSDDDEGHKPVNREYRDGKMYYFKENEEIPLEISYIEAPVTRCWPRDWLPKDVNDVRLLSVDYDSFVSHWYSVIPVESSGRTVSQRSSEILDKLISAGVGERPIVWVTHSAGGILVKQIISTAHESNDSKISQLCKNTKGVFFYSTPHFGSNLAKSFSDQGNVFWPTIEMIEMCAGSQDLLDLNEKFKEIVETYNYRVVSMGEMLGTLTNVGNIFVNMVPLKSADPGYGEFYALKTDHLSVCKPISRGSFSYVKLVNYLKELIKEIKPPSTN